MNNFENAFQLILSAEGGYSDDSSDPGGKTRYGITEAVARANGYAGDMRELPLATAKAIYRKDYWDACRCDELPWRLALFTFDAAVNQGVGAATRMLQAALGTVQDGQIGSVTMRLAAASTAWHAAKFMALRAQRYQSTRNFDRFGQGWLTRIFSLAMEV